MTTMNRTRGMHALIWALRILIGGFFIFSGFTKINDIEGFAYKLDKYWIAFEGAWGLGFSALSEFSVAISAVVSVIETLLGIFLILGTFHRITTGLLFLMIIFFTFLTGWSAITRSVQDCGCFGAAFTIDPWQSFTKDVVLLVLIGVVYVRSEHVQPIFDKQKALQWGVSGALSLVVIGFTWYTHAYLPVMDFRACKVGNSLVEVTKLDPETGQADLRNYMPLEASCDSSATTGKRVLVFMKDMDKVSPEHFQALTDLHAELNDSGILMLGLTSSTSGRVKALKEQHGLEFCISSQDKTMIKTCIRSNPGVVLLQDAIIQAKWSKRRIPDRAAIEQHLN